MNERLLLTWEVPWLAVVEVHVGDDDAGEAPVLGLAGEVVGHHLLVGGVEPEPRRHAVAGGEGRHGCAQLRFNS